jgi:hypothetical protein
MMKRRILRLIQARAEAEAADLAAEFVRATGEEREAILAGLEFERWLAESCRECLQ